MSSQKQNREGVVGAQADNIVLRRSRARDVVGPRPGSDISTPKIVLHSNKRISLPIIVCLECKIRFLECQ